MANFEVWSKRQGDAAAEPDRSDSDKAGHSGEQAEPAIGTPETEGSDSNSKTEL